MSIKLEEAGSRISYFAIAEDRSEGDLNQGEVGDGRHPSPHICNALIKLQKRKPQPPNRIQPKNTGLTIAFAPAKSQLLPRR